MVAVDIHWAMAIGIAVNLDRNQVVLHQVLVDVHVLCVIVYGHIIYRDRLGLTMRGYVL